MSPWCPLWLPWFYGSANAVFTAFAKLLGEGSTASFAGYFHTGFGSVSPGYWKRRSLESLAKVGTVRVVILNKASSVPNCERVIMIHPKMMVLLEYMARTDFKSHSELTMGQVTMLLSTSTSLWSCLAVLLLVLRCPGFRPDFQYTQPSHYVRPDRLGIFSTICCCFEKVAQDWLVHMLCEGNALNSNGSTLHFPILCYTYNMGYPPSLEQTTHLQNR